MALEELTKHSKKGKYQSSLKSDDGKKSRKLTRQSEWGSFISVIDNSEDDKGIEQSESSMIHQIYKAFNFLY